MVEVEASRWVQVECSSEAEAGAEARVLVVEVALVVSAAAALAEAVQAEVGKVTFRESHCRAQSNFPFLLI